MSLLPSLVSVVAGFAGGVAVSGPVLAWCRKELAAAKARLDSLESGAKTEVAKVEGQVQTDANKVNSVVKSV